MKYYETFVIYIKFSLHLDQPRPFSFIRLEKAAEASCFVTFENDRKCRAMGMAMAMAMAMAISMASIVMVSFVLSLSHFGSQGKGPFCALRYLKCSDMKLGPHLYHFSDQWEEKHYSIHIFE